MMINPTNPFEIWWDQISLKNKKINKTPPINSLVHPHNYTHHFSLSLCLSISLELYYYSYSTFGHIYFRSFLLTIFHFCCLGFQWKATKKYKLFITTNIYFMTHESWSKPTINRHKSESTVTLNGLNDLYGVDALVNATLDIYWKRDEKQNLKFYSYIKITPTNEHHIFSKTNH